MSACPTCDDLRRQLREAREELAEWQLSAEPDATAENALVVKASVVLRAKRITAAGRFVAPGDLRFLRALIRAAGRPVSHPDLLDASMRYGLEPRGDAKLNVVRASICRTLLASQGIPDAIVSVHAYGYEMPKGVAARVNDWLEGLVA